ncbi:translocase of chloroplast 159, chloroplastic [Tanacetum coccineum]
MDSSISANHGDNASIMVGFDIQPIGKQLAYIVKGETKFKNLKKNKTSVGISVTFLGENVVTGFKVEDQIALGRQYSIIGSASTVRFQTDYAYGANIEIQRRELDYQIGQSIMATPPSPYHVFNFPMDEPHDFDDSNLEFKEDPQEEFKEDPEEEPEEDPKE